MTTLAAKTQAKLKEKLAELSGITGKLRAYRERNGLGNLAEVWELEKQRRRLNNTVKLLQRGGGNICVYCGGVKSLHAATCRKCRIVDCSGKEEERAKAIHNSVEAQALLSQPVEPKRVDRVIRAFRRWFEWRKRYVERLWGLTTAADLQHCACGAYKTMAAKTCDECREAKKVLRRRIHSRGRNLQDEPVIVQKRRPRIVHMLAPSRWETDTSNSWDNMIRNIEDG
jgi:ribosomal protein L40E